jgi:RNA polymerase subunit RPABC4/transcription elongation factor Spt4
MDLACPKCGRIYQDIQKCPSCGANLTRDWSGKAAIIKPENSRIAKQMDVNNKGVYALKL